MRFFHKPVMPDKVIEYLQVLPGKVFIDATVGEGGHTLAMLQATQGRIKILAIDRDSKILKRAKQRILEAGFWASVDWAKGRFSQIDKIAKRKGFLDADGVLADLGVSMWHYKGSGRGFSFEKEEVLDMRYDLSQDLTALEIVNLWPPQEIERILRELGEEKEAKNIVKAIVERRQKEPILTARELHDLVVGVKKRKPKNIDPATQTFMALRMAVNLELQELEIFLERVWKVLKKGGRLVVITFHSLEERVVWHKFRELKKQGSIKVITKRGITPSFTEIKTNKSARSAKLWCAQKL